MHDWNNEWNGGIQFTTQCLSTQLILWNAVWRKFLADSSIGSGAEVANLNNDIA